MSSSAFTLLEILIVLHVIALLAVIAIPAIYSAMRATRKMDCAGRLHQLGLALSSYAGSHGTYPAAAYWEPGGLVLSPKGLVLPGSADLTTEDPESWTFDRFRGNFFLSLLPYMEAAAVAEQWNYEVPVSAPHNSTVRATMIELFLCPEDVGRKRSQPCSLQGGGWARGNYAVNAGPDPACLDGKFWDETFGSRAPDWSCRTLYPRRPDVRGVEFAPKSVLGIAQLWGTGVAGVNCSFAPDDLKDGLSNTVVIDEILAGIRPDDRRGCWAMPGIGPSAVFAFGNAVNGTDDRGRWAVDQIQNCHSDDAPGPCEDNLNMDIQAYPRSSHVGGLHVLMADASVQFLSNDTQIKIWKALHTRDSVD